MQNVDLEVGAGIRLDVTQVPGALRHLVPIVEKWGFSSLDEQDEFVEAMLEARPSEVELFNRLMDASSADIRAWLAALDTAAGGAGAFVRRYPGHASEFFVNALNARESTGALGGEYVVSEPSEETRRRRFEAALGLAEASFRRGEYDQVVERLDSYRDLLTPAQERKLEIAKKRSRAR